MKAVELKYDTPYWDKSLNMILILRYIHKHPDGTSTYNFEELMSKNVITYNEELVEELEHYYKGEQ